MSDALLQSYTPARDSGRSAFLVGQACLTSLPSRELLCLLPGVDRNHEVEFRTDSNRALDPDSAFVHLDDLASDRQSQARPDHLILGVAFEPLVAPKEAVQELVRDALPVVSHADLDVAILEAAGNEDLAPLGRVFGRVAQQVRDDLEQPVDDEHR